MAKTLQVPVTVQMEMAAARRQVSVEQLVSDYLDQAPWKVDGLARKGVGDLSAEELETLLINSYGQVETGQTCTVAESRQRVSEKIQRWKNTK